MKSNKNLFILQKKKFFSSPLGGPQITDWAVPHQSKLKYTQLFNTTDRTRTGFLTGPQAKSILIQTKLSQGILAQVL